MSVRRAAPWPVLVRGLVALALLAPGLAVAAQAGPDQGLATAEADRALLERVYSESSASAQRREAGWSEYAGFLVRRVAGWFGDALEQAASSVGLNPAVVVLVAWGLLGAALITLLTLIVVRARRLRHAATEPPQQAVAAPAGRSEPSSVWRDRIDRRLAEGRVAEALESVWWWLAHSLCGERADASWTGRELVVHGARPDLRGPVSRLDAWAYGPRPPSASEVGDWVHRIETRLTGAAAPAEARGEARP